MSLLDQHIANLEKYKEEGGKRYIQALADYESYLRQRMND
jgi:hypothetical protein